MFSSLLSKEERESESDMWRDEGSSVGSSEMTFPLSVLKFVGREWGIICVIPAFCWLFCVSVSTVVSLCL